jgi:hypothetical protein
VLVLLVLPPAIGELLSGSSPPLQFFNPVFFLLLVALCGCEALLVRGTVARYLLNAVGVLLLGAAYGTLGAEYRFKDTACSVPQPKDTHLAA